MKANHTYEEMRAADRDILARREQVPYKPSQYENLILGLGQVFARGSRRLHSLGKKSSWQPGNRGAAQTLRRIARISRRLGFPPLYPPPQP